MNKKLFILIVLLVTSLTYLSAQEDGEKPCQEIDNKKAKKLYEQGIDKKNKKDDRMTFLDQAIKMEPDYVDANFAYAMERVRTLIYENKPFKPVESYFLKVIEICPKYHSNPYYYLGFSYYEQEKWEESAKYLKEFLNFKDDDVNKFDKNFDGLLSEAKKMYKYAKLYGEIFKNPVPFDPNPVAGVCTPNDEYLPIITADDSSKFYLLENPLMLVKMALLVCQPIWK